MGERYQLFFFRCQYFLFVKKDVFGVNNVQGHHNFLYFCKNLLC